MYHASLNQCPTDGSYKLLNKCGLKQDMPVDTDFYDSQAGPRQLETCPPTSPTVEDGPCSQVCDYLRPQLTRPALDTCPNRQWNQALGLGRPIPGTHTPRHQGGRYTLHRGSPNADQ